MNKSHPLKVQEVSFAVAELMPNIIRGVQLDFFASRAITQTQFMMVVGIHAYGRCRMSELAKDMKIKMPTATGIADRLVAGGYVRRFSEPNDRRAVILELTPEGQKFIGEFQRVLRRRWEEVLNSLGNTDLAAFYRVVTKLRNNLKRIP
ncbi:MAG: hypothetical protein AUJ72_03655 [Candidatus Omnitrophica bacterium CG1_02_46_14]|nr:MAG: hypothetical protein AUJ72_03655 [Candidatus Omnitrophica bacterium CG1_02_46_14]